MIYRYITLTGLLLVSPLFVWSQNSSNIQTAGTSNRQIHKLAKAFDIQTVSGLSAVPFSLKDLSGRTVTLTTYRGKLLLLNLWATWCMPCRTEMPALNKLYHEFKDKGLVVVGASTDTADAEPSVRQFITQNKIDFPVLLDQTQHLPEKYNTSALPTTIIILPDTQLFGIIYGYREWDNPKFKELIRHLLNLDGEYAPPRVETPTISLEHKAITPDRVAISMVSFITIILFLALGSIGAGIGILILHRQQGSR